MRAKPFISAVVLALAANTIVNAETFTFDCDKAGEVPQGWSIRQTNPTKALATWHVVTDSTAPSKPNVMALAGTENYNGTFNLAIAESTSFKDLDLTGQVKPVGGEEDQGGGPIWRCKDENNSDICRVNPLEANFRVYKVVNGRRKQLDSAKVPSRAGKWYTVRATMVGDQITCYLDGEKLLETRDNTFANAGMIGFWTKADAVTSFDDVAVRESASVTEIPKTDAVPAGPFMLDQPALVWEAAYTSTPPTIDGRIDKVWGRAKPLTVVVREAFGGNNPRQVILRALYTDDMLYVLAQWPDVTRSDMRDPYVWDPRKNEYDRPTKPDDQFALEFPMRGDFGISMLATDRSFVADVWHWKAGRSNLGGWVDDKRHIIGQTPGGGAHEYQLGGHGSVYIARPMDEGTASYSVKPKPSEYVGDVINAFESREPSGSVADVRGKGVHDGKSWTLEISRKLNTGNPDDAVIDPSKDNPCAIAVLDDELYWHHSVSGLLLLQFAPH